MEADVPLANIYYGTSAGAFRGPRALYEEAKAQNVANLSLARVRRFLASQPTYTIYRPARRNYPRNHIRAYAVGEIVQVQLFTITTNSLLILCIVD